MIFQSAISTFFGFFDVVYKADSVGQADAVGICDNGRLAKHISHDQVGAFSPNSGEGKKGIEVAWNIILVFLVKDLHAGTDVTGFAFPSPQGFTIASISSGVADASAATSGYLAYRS